MLINININGESYNLDSNLSVLQACELAHIIIPRFCYHERLSVAGNCRMCLVEVDKMPKLQVSCSIPITQNMSIKTETPTVKKAREGILEFLLINHPLDCPICDQGGECDLQNQSLAYGSDKSRFKEFKRAVEDKNCGPLIKTIMTRCIHCTRCVRFANEIIGVPDFGTSGRGNLLEIGTYVNKLITSELSGNVIDLCPVGALTSKPYAFLSRPWELKSFESIDIFDSIHSNIRIDVRGYDLMRILPRLNEAINEEWISDKVRFAFDGLLVQRLTHPLIKDDKNFLRITSWSNAIKIILKKLNFIENGYSSYFSVGNLCDLHTLVFVKKLSLLLNSSILTQTSNKYLDVDFQSTFRFCTSLKQILKSDVCLLLGVDPKIEGPLLNYHLRKRFLRNNFIVGNIGSRLKLTFPSIHIGNSFNKFKSIFEGKHFFCKLLRKAKNPLIIIGKEFRSYIGFSDIKIFIKIFEKNLKIITHFWNGLNFYNSQSSDFSFFNLGLNQGSFFIKNQVDFLYIVEDYKPINKNVLSNFTIFQGSHGCLNAQNSEIVLPTCSFVESSLNYINCEGLFQQTQSAVPPLGLSVKGYSILSTLFRLINNGFDPDFDSDYTYDYNNTKRKLLCMDVLDDYDDTNFMKFLLPPIINDNNFFSNIYKVENNILINDFYFSSSTFDDFYQTDFISKLSKNMLKCSKNLVNKSSFEVTFR